MISPGLLMILSSLWNEGLAVVPTDVCTAVRKETRMSIHQTASRMKRTVTIDNVSMRSENPISSGVPYAVRKMESVTSQSHARLRGPSGEMIRILRREFCIR